MSPITGTPVVVGAVSPSVAKLREYLPQVAAGATQDAQLADALAVALGVVEGELTFSYVAVAASASAKAWNSNGGAYLRVPAHGVGTLTALSWPGGEISGDGTAYTVTTDYVAAADDHHVLYRGGLWPAGRYVGTAKWGTGAMPSVVAQVVLELAVNNWRGKDRGMFSDIQGVEGGGAVGYARALTNQQRGVLQRERERWGIWGVG